jgi:hypothetical protein
MTKHGFKSPGLSFFLLSLLLMVEFAVCPLSLLLSVLGSLPALVCHRDDSHDQSRLAQRSNNNESSFQFNTLHRNGAQVFLTHVESRNCAE